MSEAGKPKTDREITYQVGWKKGKIHYHEAPVPEKKAEIPIEKKETRKNPLFQKAGSVVLHEAPYPGARTAVWTLLSLPAVLAGLMVWLIYMLSQPY